MCVCVCVCVCVLGACHLDGYENIYALCRACECTCTCTYIHVCKCMYMYMQVHPSQEGKRRQFQELTQLMRDLLDRRRQILSKTLPRVSCTFTPSHPHILIPSHPSLPHTPTPSLLCHCMQDELKELKQLVGTKIDYGNRMLAMDLVPRDDSGAPIVPKTSGVMRLFKVMKQWSQQQNNEPGVSAFMHGRYCNYHLGIFLKY